MHEHVILLKKLCTLCQSNFYGPFQTNLFTRHWSWNLNEVPIFASKIKFHNMYSKSALTHSGKVTKGFDSGNLDILRKTIFLSECPAGQYKTSAFTCAPCPGNTVKSVADGNNHCNTEAPCDGITQVPNDDHTGCGKPSMHFSTSQSKTRNEFFFFWKIQSWRYWHFCITFNINKLEIIAMNVLDITYHSQVYRICQIKWIHSYIFNTFW